MMVKRTNSALLATRIRAIRMQQFGEDVSSLAQLIGVSTPTWENYESGVVIPGLALLSFIDVTNASPRWLLAGDGPMTLDALIQEPKSLAVTRSAVVPRSEFPVKTK